MEKSESARKRRETFLRRFENQNKSVNNNSNTNIDKENTEIPLSDNESNTIESATTTGSTLVSKENSANPIENDEQQLVLKKVSNLEDEQKSSTEEEKDEGSKKIISTVNFVSEDIEKIQYMSHKAAREGDIDSLRTIIETRVSAVHLKDKNGWMPIHEAVRGGHTNILDLLVNHGADINATTNFGEGSTPLRLALENFGKDHSITVRLQKLGATNTERSSKNEAVDQSQAQIIKYLSTCGISISDFSLTKLIGVLYLFSLNYLKLRVLMIRREKVPIQRICVLTKKRYHMKEY